MSYPSLARSGGRSRCPTATHSTLEEEVAPGRAALTQPGIHSQSPPHGVEAGAACPARAGVPTSCALKARLAGEAHLWALWDKPCKMATSRVTAIAGVVAMPLLTCGGQPSTRHRGPSGPSRACLRSCHLYRLSPNSSTLEIRCLKLHFKSSPATSLSESTYLRGLREPELVTPSLRAVLERVPVVLHHPALPWTGHLL